MPINKKTLEAIRKALPYGAIKKIAQKLSYHPEYVGAVLRGDVAENLMIIKEAQRLVAKKMRLQNKIVEEFRRSQSESNEA